MSSDDYNTLIDDEISSDKALNNHNHNHIDEQPTHTGNKPLTKNQIIGIVVGIIAIIAVVAGVSAYILNNNDDSNECVIGSVEDCSTECNYPAIFASVVPFSKLSNITSFPDPYMSIDGRRINSQDQWKCRRAEIAAQLQTYELGIKPLKTELESVTGEIFPAVGGYRLVVSMSRNGSYQFTAPISMPPNRTFAERIPAMIVMSGFCTLNQTTLNELNIAIISFPTDLIAQQQSGKSRGLGMFYDMFGVNHTAGAMSAWAFGISRLIDALEQTSDDHMIDVTKLGVTGCSRLGKGALVAGALDERIALTIPQESGAGGSANWRLMDYTYTDADPTQRLRQIVTENVWFTSSFSQFGMNVPLLPYDHHMLMSMVAPRGLLVLDNTSPAWLGNYSSFFDSVAGRSIFTDLGVGDHMGVSQRGGFQHCAWSTKQQQPLEAFLKKFLLGQQGVNTSVIITDETYSFDKSMWINWETPW